MQVTANKTNVNQFHIQMNHSQPDVFQDQRRKNVQMILDQATTGAQTLASREPLAQKPVRTQTKQQCLQTN